MIQRIQSVYLMLSLILVALMAWLPLGEIATASTIYSFNIRGVFNEQTAKMVVNGWPLLMMLIIIELIQLLVIFGFKNRVLQMRLSTFNIILMVGIFVVCFVFVKMSLKSIGEGTYVFKIVMAFPFVALILNYLAIRAIARDEALVRSIDRIR